MRPNHNADSAAMQTLDSQWTRGNRKLLTFSVISSAPAGVFPQEKRLRPQHTNGQQRTCHALRPVGAFAALGAAAIARVLLRTSLFHACHPAPPKQNEKGRNQRTLIGRLPSPYTMAAHSEPSTSVRTLRSSNRRGKRTGVPAAEQHVSFVPRCMLIWQETRSVHLTSFTQGPNNTSEEDQETIPSHVHRLPHLLLVKSLLLNTLSTY